MHYFHNFKSKFKNTQFYPQAFSLKGKHNNNTTGTKCDSVVKPT